MVINNKVLTVSYGTFSCTLEGFDDSFGTMKAIAEYFRDLASDDRYFGAEPPQPDADMLARIAQREITRQVEAHSTGTGGIVLRASDTIAAPTVVAAAPAAMAQTTPAQDVTPESVLEPTPEPVAEVQPEPTPQAAAVEEVEEPEVKTETVAPAPPELAEAESADLDADEPIIILPEDVEDDVDADITPEVEIETIDADEDIAEAEIDEVPVEEDAADEIADEAPIAVEDTTAQEPVEAVDVEAEPTDAVEFVPELEITPAPPVAEEVRQPEIVPAADSIAAKLLRIRAVVSQNDALAPTDDYIEDEDTDSFAEIEAEEIAEVLNSDDDALSAAEAQDVEDEVSSVLDQLDAIVDTADEPVTDAPDSAEEFFAGSGSDQDQDDDTLFDDSDDTQADDLSVDEISSILSAQASEQDATPPEAGPEAGMVKVKRADLETAMTKAQLNQYAEAGEDIAEEALAEQSDSSLTAEDEADLMRELAAVEDDLTGDQDADEANEADENIFGDDIVSEVADEAGEETAAHAALSQIVNEDAGDVSRLMEAADEKLDDPEGSSRRQTYSHLRAAVAAAEAEKSAGGTIGGPVQDDEYREDLADVVRPRRPAIEGERTERLAVDSKPAPLKLVAEQRVDEGAGLAQRGPVRPRRVMTVPITPGNVSEATGADSAFADFAERVGATELPELLEAAAAYLSFVEGQDKFSRPQLMNKVRLVKQDDYNREDGLRSFGQLLRDGKIEKRGGGRFAASVEIGFRPDSDEREVG